MGALLCTDVIPSEAFHLKRVDCRLEPASGTGDPFAVRLLLNDFRVQGAALFSGQSMPPGSKARLLLSQPRELVVAGTVAWTQECVFRRRVFGSFSYAFRIGFAFEPSGEEELKQIRALFEEISRSFPGVDPLQKPKAA
jgi:hypothetical protein